MTPERLARPKERPVIFSAPMVRAILAEQKTQTRRVVRPPPVLVDGRTWEWPKASTGGPPWKLSRMSWGDGLLRLPTVGTCCPYGIHGDRLWVRETWVPSDDDSYHRGVIFRADGALLAYDEKTGQRYGEPAIEPDCRHLRWRSPIHMPRWASRISLEVTAVRVERLQSITEEDARAEGVAPPASSGNGARDWFAAAWDDLNAKRGYPWTSSPWVWVISFRRADAEERAA